MKYVLDSSVAAKWVLPEVDSDKAIRLRDEFAAAIHQLLAPDVFSIELAHALTRGERQGRVGIGDAAVLWGVVMSTPPKFSRSSLLVARAIDISSRMRIGVYDCLYVALAERRKCALITADTKLVNNLQAHFFFVKSLASF